jgi:hypothetical protein
MLLLFVNNPIAPLTQMQLPLLTERFFIRKVGAQRLVYMALGDLIYYFFLSTASTLSESSRLRAFAVKFSKTRPPAHDSNI